MSRRPWGNQHVSLHATLLDFLFYARLMLANKDVASAKWFLDSWRHAMASVPASTRRRWRCGR